MHYKRWEVRFRAQIGFDGLDKSIQPAKSFKFIAAVHLCRVQRAPQHIDRLIVGAQRDREWMPVLPAERE